MCYPAIIILKEVWEIRQDVCPGASVINAVFSITEEGPQAVTLNMQLVSSTGYAIGSLMILQ